MAEAGAAEPAARGSDGAIRVLSVIGDRALANTVYLTLEHLGFMRRVVATVAEGKTAIEEWKPHLLLVDIDVEAGGAIQLIDEALANGPIRVIALTRRSDLRGKLDAFERGADDYIGVPFVPDDLVARAHAVLRRTHGKAGELVPRLRIGDLEIDLLNRKVLAGDHELHLTSLRAGAAVPPRRERRDRPHARADPRRGLGHRLRHRKQCRGSAREDAAGEASGRLAQASLHRDRSRHGLPIRDRFRGAQDN